MFFGAHLHGTQPGAPGASIPLKSTNYQESVCMDATCMFSYISHTGNLNLFGFNTLRKCKYIIPIAW